MNTERQQLLGDVPPPRRRFPSRRLRFSPTLVAGGIVFAIMLLVVVLNINTNPAKKLADAPPLEGVTELIAPDRLVDSDLTGGSGFDVRSGMVDLPEGGWIQTTNERGEPAQQYRFTKLDPTPEGYGPGWLLMQQPQADFYLSPHRVISMTGDSALAFAPSRTLTEGTLTGNVVIRMYESTGDRPPDPRRDTPTLEVRTGEASFDNFTGEIICAGEVDIQTPTAHLPGRGLRLRLNDQRGRIELLTLKEVDTIRLIAPEEAQLTTATRAPALTSPRAILARFRQSEPEVISTETKKPQYYVLSLHRNITIRQGDDSTGRIATGDEMRIVFSLEGSSPGSVLAREIPRPIIAANRIISFASPHTLAHHLATLAVASFPDDTGLFRPGPDDLITTINCAGGLDMVPAEHEADRLDSPGDLRMELSGAPMVIDDRAEDFHGEGGKVIFHGREEKIELLASAVHPVRIKSPQLEGGGEHFFYSKNGRRAGFRKAGWLNAGAQPPENPEENADPLAKLHIIWTEGVDFTFAEPNATPAASPTDAEPNNKPILTSAEFRGEVKVTSDEGAISGDLIHLELGVDEAGKSVPESMLVRGEVKARDSDITVWADDLDITFIVSERDAAAPSPEKEEDDSSIFGGKMDIDTLNASGDVQALLADGSRAFADRIHGRAETQTIEFTGDNVVFVSDRLLLDRGKHYILRKADGVFHGDGPGQARIFNQPLRVDDDRRILRPWSGRPAPLPEVQARWNRTMHYDHTVNDGAGRIDLAGKVEAVSQPSPLQLDSLKSDTLSLAFVLEDTDSSDSEMSEKDISPPPSAPSFNGDDKQRRLSRMVARGEAKMESRSWMREDHSDPPRIFSIAAPYIEYDNLTEEALAEGEGELLIRDPRPRNQDEENTGVSTAPFSSSGATLFRWTKKLEMTPELGDSSHLSLHGEVRVIHKSGAGGIVETSVITGEQIDATISRVNPLDTETPPKTTTQPPDQPGDQLSFGGPREIRKLSGRGNIYIRTPTREVSCDRFDYNLITEIAEIRAAGNGRVTVKTVGSPDLIRAGLVIWDMARDAITIERAAGGGR